MLQKYLPPPSKMCGVRFHYYSQNSRFGTKNNCYKYNFLQQTSFTFAIYFNDKAILSFFKFGWRAFVNDICLFLSQNVLLKDRISTKILLNQNMMSVNQNFSSKLNSQKFGRQHTQLTSQ